MRCPDCSKFVSLEFNEPELEGDLDVTEEGVVTGSVRIVRACADCGTELKEASFDLEFTPNNDQIKDHLNPEGQSIHELEVEEDGVSQIEEGGGRYAKSYFGAEVSFHVRCSCDAAKKTEERWSLEGTMSDKIAASGMDEM
jgi:hypothetical protein